MAESLEDFLGLTNKTNSIKVGGSMACQECNEIVSEGWIDEDTMILSYKCSKNHDSKVKV
jgi:hypothetical protein